MACRRIGKIVAISVLLFLFIKTKFVAHYVQLMTAAVKSYGKKNVLTNKSNEK